MANCWYCDNKLDSLPFKCKFCGNTFCGDHRLPESHECAVEFKQGNNYGLENDIPPRTKYAGNSRGRVKDYRPRRLERPQSRFSARMQTLSQLTAAQLLIILNLSMLVIIFILNLINMFNFPLFLSVQDLIPPNYFYYTIFTSTIIPISDFGFFGIFSLIIFLVMVYFMAKSIETGFGRSMALKVYFSGAFIASASILLIVTLFMVTNYDSVIFPPFIIDGQLITLADLSFYSSYGGLIALVTFRSIIHAEQPVRFYLYFFPVSMKMKHVKWIFIGLEFINGLLGGVYAIQNFSNILGACGGMIFAGIVLKNQYSARRF